MHEPIALDALNWCASRWLLAEFRLACWISLGPLPFLRIEGHAAKRVPLDRSICAGRAIVSAGGSVRYSGTLSSNVKTLVDASSSAVDVGGLRWMGLLLVALGTCVACGEDERIPPNSSLVAGEDAGGNDNGSDDDDDDDGDDDDDPPAANPGNTGRGGDPTPAPAAPAAPAPPAVNFNSDFGRTCESDDECPGDLTCLTPDSEDLFGGGPANGYCTLDCAAGGDALCQENSSGAICVETGVTALCWQGCETQLENQCQGREDVSCDDITLSNATTTVGFCRPLCLNDADCGDGLFCSVSDGVCLAEEPPGKAVGEQCDPDVAGECAGFCLPFTEDYAACSGLCNIGAIGCGGSAESEVPGEPVCEFPFSPGAGIGDLARCIQGCECDADCSHPDARCAPLAPAEQLDDARDFYGSTGFCLEEGLAAEARGVTEFLEECPDRPDVGAPMSSVPAEAGVADAGDAVAPAPDAVAPDAAADGSAPAVP